MSQLFKRTVTTLCVPKHNFYSHCIRLVLEEKGVIYEAVEIDLRNPPQEFTDVCPALRLPTLIDRDLVLYQPLVIMEYLDERFPHPHLMPIYPVERARLRQMILQVWEDWYALLPSLEKGDSHARQEFADSLLTTSRILEHQTFFFDNSLTLLDCIISPLLLYLQRWKVTLPNSAQKTMELHANSYGPPFLSKNPHLGGKKPLQSHSETTVVRL